MRTVLLGLGLFAFIAVAGIWAFRLTAGLDELPAAGWGAFAAILTGAGLLITLFLVLMGVRRRGTRSDTDDRGEAGP